MSRVPRGSPWVLAASLVTAASCAPSVHYPGSEVLGTFAFTGTRLSSTCSFDDGGAGLDGPLSFTGVFSLNPQTGALDFTVGTTSHDGELIGEHFRVDEDPQYRDLGCESMGNEVDESIQGDFYGYDTPEGMARRCPDPTATDAGAPSDGGSSTDAGPDIADGGPTEMMDAGAGGPVLVCGQLIDVIHADLDAGCNQSSGFPCQVVYELVGLAQE